MIIHPLTKPINLKKLEALRRRIPIHHRARPLIDQKYAREAAGYKGEVALEYPLKFLPKDNYLILHHIRLKSKITGHFQMDCLLLSRKFYLILEVKNITGTLDFDDKANQLTRTTDEGVKEGFQYPVSQVQLQKEQLTAWLNNRKFPTLPIEYLVVISSPKSILQFPPHSNLHQIVLHNIEIPKRVKELEMIHTTEKTNNKELKKLANRLVKEHSPLSTNYLHVFKIPVDDLIKGVHCPQCSFIPMKRIHGRWYCPNCTHTNKDAHIAALKDYSLLVSEEIMNQQAVEFLLLDSSYVAKALLKSIDLRFTGSNKGRKYFLQFND